MKGEVDRWVEKRTYRSRWHEPLDLKKKNRFLGMSAIQSYLCVYREISEEVSSNMADR